MVVVISVVGVIVIVRAFLCYKRYQARSVAAADKHAWVNRPAGWANDGGNAEAAVAPQR
ncbi:SubName: Full=Uncharacterized protein {ECO:0000313/EMBL:CCA70726.1} [Serendipita indica DSM 11827]|nr:SubName: Full=Uncharacterized protein {ECO:0000313/EMBL:CCA70726.1} [Serendipita indica DSM 11827]